MGGCTRKGRRGDGRWKDTGKLLNIIEGGVAVYYPDAPPSPPPPHFQVLPAAWVKRGELSGARPSGNQSSQGQSVSQKGSSRW